MTTSLAAIRGGTPRWLTLAASPTFAVMAVITANDSGASAFCSAVPSLFPVNGMAAMYLLMCFFHLSPWLKLAEARRAPD